jgi:hypothetical protein
MPAKKKRATQNPTDPNLLARSVVEAAIGGPLSDKPKATIKKKSKARRT